MKLRKRFLKYKTKSGLKVKITFVNEKDNIAMGDMFLEDGKKVARTWRLDGTFAAGSCSLDIK